MSRAIQSVVPLIVVVCTAAPIVQAAPTSAPTIQPAQATTRPAPPGGAASQPTAKQRAAGDDPPAPSPRPTDEQRCTGAVQPPTIAPCRRIDTPVDEPYRGLDHTGTPAKPPLAEDLPANSGDGRRDRAKPNYDGRPAGRPSAENVLVWIPRGALYPAHLVLEYGVRRPLVGGVTLAEKHHVFQRVYEFLTFDDGKAGIFPTAFFDSGRGFWGGALFFYNDIGNSGHSLAVSGGYGTSDWYSVIARDSFRVFRNDGGLVTLSGGYANEPNLAFTGIGPDTHQLDERYFAQRQGRVDLALRASLGYGLSYVEIAAGYANTKILSGQVPSVDEPGSPFVVQGGASAVPGFGQQHQLLSFATAIAIDSRSPARDFTPGSGLRAEVFGSLSVDPADRGLSYGRFGAVAAAFWDISGINHVLGARVYFEMLEAIGNDALPATSLITLGGERYLRGFVSGRFRGESALVFSANYRYPVWTFLDGELFASLGNVFDKRFRQATLSKMTMSWGVGLRTNTSRQTSIDLLVAFGTNQLRDWDDDFDVDNVRVVLGASHGF